MEILEKEILDIINETLIDKKYIGNLKVILEDDIYILLLYMDQEFSPLAIGYQGSEKDFKEFVRKEIKSRQMERATFWTAVQELPSIVCDEDGDWDVDWDDELII